MPSPFPGMNPFLEPMEIWLDFHQSMIPAIREALAEQVRPKYLVKIEERLYIHDQSEDGEPLPRRFIGRSDVSVADPMTVPSEGAASVVIEAPVSGRVPMPADVERSGYIEIRDRQTRELVTVIELLSPTNKRRGPDREQFLAKRREVLLSPANYIEIDLLRGGPRLPVEDLPDCDYYALVSRAELRPEVGLWPLGLRDLLPTIPVPLRPSDGDAQIHLQELLHRVYDAAGYADYIYDSPPEPLLEPADAEWARSLLE